MVSLILLISGFAYGQTVLHTDDFNGELGKGADGFFSDLVGVDWSIDVSNANLSDNLDYFKVNGDDNDAYFEGRDIDGICIWESTQFSIAGYTNLELNIDLSASGVFESNDKLDVAIVIDGVEELVFESDCSTGDCFIDGVELENGFKKFTSPINTGNNAIVKVYMNNDNGSEKLQFDNIEVRDLLLGVGPTIILSKSDMNGFVYEINQGPSTLQSFTIEASGLTDNASISAPVDFEISTDGSNFSNSITLSETNGFIDETSIYIRLKSGLAIDTYNDILSVSSPGATTQNITLAGRVREPLELFITEVLDPLGDGSEGFAKYIEIYNASMETVDFGIDDYYISSQINGSIPSGPFKLTGKLAPKSYYIITSTNLFVRNAYDKAYPNRPPNLVVDINLGNFDDTFFLSTSGNDFENAANTLFDIYGQLGVLGENSPWDYKDSHAYRQNPTVKEASSTWLQTEWVIEPAEISDMTPGYGDNDYIYVDDTDKWGQIGLGDPSTIAPNGSRNIFINNGETTLSSNLTIGDLVVRSGGTLNLEAGVKLKVTGDILNEGKIIFKSNATDGSAVLEAISADTRVIGNRFEIHRYIPDSNRAFRYLSPSVTTSTTIKDNWQEGLNNNIGINYPADNQGGTAGFGTHITGSKTGDNGFDATETGNPSMYEFNETTQDWNPIPNTDTKTFNAGEAYAILIRGDRYSPLNSNFDMGDPTTLRTTGEIYYGNFELDNSVLSPTSGSFNLIGNPYQSQVDLKNLMDNHAEELDNNKVYIYDPTLGDRGAYATIDLTNLNFSSVPSGTSANQFLQPNQAFFVQTTGSNPALVFSESTKDNDDLQTSTFSTQNMMPNHINVNLKNNNEKLIDGVRLVFDDSHNLKVDNYDAVKFWNLDENISIYSNNKNLSIEKRPQPSVTDTTQLHLYNHTKPDYKLEAEYITNTTDNNNVYLLDQYTQDKISLLENQLVSYDFRVNTSIPETTAKDRFLIVYDSKTLSVNSSQERVSVIYPNPLSNHRLFININQSLIGKKGHIKLFDSVGRLLNNWDFENLKNQETLHLDNLQNGLYLLQFSSGGHLKTFKLKKI